MSHEPASWDTAELQGVPYILGITHPTGFPFYVLVGYAWSHLLPIGSIAFRMNAMCGVAMAFAALTAYATARTLGAWRPVALLSTLWYAFTQDVWSHAIRAEAQDVAVACEAFAIYAFVRWMKGGSDRWFAGAWGMLGLGIAAHPNAVWLVPGFVAGALVAKRRPAARLVAGALALTAAGLLLYLYLPLRSAYVVAHGLDPTHVLVGTNGGIFWNYNNPSTARGLLRALSGSESDAPRYFLASFNPVHLQDALAAFVRGITDQFDAFVLVLVLIGVAIAWKRDWRTTLFLCIACTAALLFSVTYPNEADVGRYRMMALWLVVPLLGAIVPAGLSGDARTRLVRAAVCVVLAIGAGMAFYAQRRFFVHAPGEGGRWVIDAVRPVVPRGGVIVVAGWLDATSLAYGAYADHSLPNRIVVSGWDPHIAGEYETWAKTRPVFILADPHDVTAVPGAKAPVRLDDYHELFAVNAPRPTGR
ncbi:MAG: DUF2723 domain-containing protein [Candidatus Tumulicola sp.]